MFDRSQIAPTALEVQIKLAEDIRWVLVAVVALDETTARRSLMDTNDIKYNIIYKYNVCNIFIIFMSLKTQKPEFFWAELLIMNVSCMYVHPHNHWIC